MPIHPLAGQPPPPAMLADIAALVSAYYTGRPDPGEPRHQVEFGTSGHRGCSRLLSFNEAHILAIAQAVCEYRQEQGVSGPFYLGKDTHALSEPAQATAIEVLAANGVELRIAPAGAFTPTPVVSHAILTWNRGRREALADGMVITPSHNPPDNGGIKYNPPHGGPADTGATKWIAGRANALMRDGNRGVRRIALAAALKAATTRVHDFQEAYVADLESVLDMAAIRNAGLRLGADALGGSGLAYWAAIAERYKLNIETLNAYPDPTFRFMTLDHDGKIRMDCSSPHAMASLVALKDKYDIAFGNDPDFDRHGIVTPGSGLLNPNHYLAVAINYLFRHRPGWHPAAAVGKTLVSSSMIDRVAAGLGRPLREVPVGFKWFVDGLLDGSCGFGGEESAGASFLRRDGKVWTTDKDGFILALLAAEITAVTGRDPGAHYRELTASYGTPHYSRIDAPATAAQRAVLGRLAPEQVSATSLAGEAITAKLTKAPGNGAGIGGLKVVAANGWFAARPSGTEDIYKIYAESFRDEAHLRRIQDEARAIVAAALGA